VPILNYTTQIEVEKTAAEVQRVLARGRARAVMTEYGENGRPTAIAFEVVTPYGPRSFVLPVNAEKVFAVMCRQRVSPKFRTREQAERVAWRILKDWIEAQLAIVSTEMVALEQVMLPYMRTEDGSTVYERYEQREFGLAIEAGGGEG
jgi:hypothetical protein